LGPSFNGEALRIAPDAFNYLVESHYRYYQFYSGTLIALIWTYSVYRIHGTTPLFGHRTDAAIIVICVVLLLGARDALTKYRSRSIQLAGFQTVLPFEGDDMTNGIDHDQGNDAHTPEQRRPQKPKS
jgi:hypothetical protein